MSQTKAQLIDGKSAAIEFSGGSASLPAISFTGDTNTGIYSPGADQVALSTGGTGRLFIDSSGSVGIGTTAPQSALSISKNDEDGIEFIAQQTTSTNQVLHYNRSTSAYSIVDTRAAQHLFRIGGNESARIDSSGRLLVGTSSNFASAYMQHIYLALGNGGTVYKNSAPGANYPIAFQSTTGNGIGSISNDNSSTSYNTASDYRLKENVTPVTDGINRLQQLKPSRFNFIADPDKTVDGFIAHEVQTIVPEAITGEKDAVDDDGNPVYQGIDQSKLVPLLTAALQEAVAKIESLEARLTAAGI